jgi:hypothetical protein
MEHYQIVCPSITGSLSRVGLASTTLRVPAGGAVAVHLPCHHLQPLSLRNQKKPSRKPPRQSHHGLLLFAIYLLVVLTSAAAVSYKILPLQSLTSSEAFNGWNCSAKHKHPINYNIEQNLVSNDGVM